jgi:hypothetical protein
MIKMHEQDAWSIFSITKDHPHHSFFAPTIMGRSYSVTTGGHVEVCNEDFSCVVGVQKISFSRPFCGASLEHNGVFTLVE